MRKRGLFLVLTDCEEGYEGVKVRINFDRVTSYCKCEEDDYTEIEVVGSGCFKVKETPEEIDLAIKRSEEE